MAKQKRLGDILIEWGILQSKELSKALEHAKSKNLRIGEALVDLKMWQRLERLQGPRDAAQYGVLRAGPKWHHPVGRQPRA